MPQADRKPKPSRDSLLFKRLKAEVKTPFKGIRKSLYLLFATSAVIGGSVFLLRFFAGWDPAENLGNLALQLAVIGLMVGLWRWDK